MCHIPCSTVITRLSKIVKMATESSVPLPDEKEKMSVEGESVDEFLKVEDRPCCCHYRNSIHSVGRSRRVITVTTVHNTSTNVLAAILLVFKG